MNAQPFNVHQVSDVDAKQTDPAPQCQRAPRHLAPLGGKAVALDFDGGGFSSDAGVVLLKDIDEPLGLTQALAAVLSDPRAARRVHFTPQDLSKQRVWQIAAGYEDANDSHTRRDDPLCTLGLDRRPETGPPLASHPTDASRQCSPQGCGGAGSVERLLYHPTQVCLSDEERHGQQEQARYDGYDGGYCFLPCHGYEGLSGRLITPMLQAKRCTGPQRLSVVQRLGKRLRQAWPETLLLLRGDSHFASPEGMQCIDAPPSMGLRTRLDE